jgi:hypothetical protein
MPLAAVTPDGFRQSLTRRIRHSLSHAGAKEEYTEFDLVLSRA